MNEKTEEFSTEFIRDMVKDNIMIELAEWCANHPSCPIHENCNLCMYEKGKEDTINKFVCNAITEFQKFDKEQGYPTLSDISVILSDVAEQLKKG